MLVRSTAAEEERRSMYMYRSDADNIVNKVISFEIHRWNTSIRRHLFLLRRWRGCRGRCCCQRCFASPAAWRSVTRSVATRGIDEIKVRELFSRKLTCDTVPALVPLVGGGEMRRS